MMTRSQIVTLFPYTTLFRSTGLQIGRFSDPLGLAELQMPAVQGVGGSLVYFMESGREREVWNDEFIPLSEQGPCHDAGLLRSEEQRSELQSPMYLVCSF